MRVLVVEDEVKLAALIRKALREQGMLADVAVTGEDAVWMAAASPYEVVILDVNSARDRWFRGRAPAARRGDPQSDPDVDRPRRRR